MWMAGGVIRYKRGWQALQLHGQISLITNPAHNYVVRMMKQCRCPALHNPGKLRVGIATRQLALHKSRNPPSSQPLLGLVSAPSPRPQVPPNYPRCKPIYQLSLNLIPILDVLSQILPLFSLTMILFQPPAPLAIPPAEARSKAAEPWGSQTQPLKSDQG